MIKIITSSHLFLFFYSQPPCKRQAFPLSPELAGPVNETSTEQPTAEKSVPEKQASITTHEPVAPEPMEVEPEATTAAPPTGHMEMKTDAKNNSAGTLFYPVHFC